MTRRLCCLLPRFIGVWLAVLTLGAALSSSTGYSYDGGSHDRTPEGWPIATGPSLGSESIRGYDRTSNLARTRSTPERSVLATKVGGRSADELPPVRGGAPGAGGRASKLGPHPGAVGSHSRFAREPGGRISKYTTFDDFGNELFRFRGSHGPFDPPFVLEPTRGKGPGARPNRAREPTPDELPSGY